MVIDNKKTLKVFDYDAGGAGALASKYLNGPRPPAQRSGSPDIKIPIGNTGGRVIDLGAPCLSPTPGFLRRGRRRRYTPNPRLYPGLKPRAEPKKQGKRTSGGPRRRKRRFTRPVPNSRLYQPAPPRPHAPPLRPRETWSPTPPAPRLDTASHAALRLANARSPPSRVFERAQEQPRRLVVSLPAAGDARCHKSRARCTMEATNRHSTSPECSDGNDASSAPSEFLAEFLSAIMRRQYAEALKYCRLILQYEPHNSTARGFYPLLQHKLQTHQLKADDASSSEDTSPRRTGLFAVPFNARQEVMQQEADEGRYSSPSGSRSGSCSSLELDSSEALPSPSPSPTPSRHTDPSDRTDHTDSTSSRWESVGERSDRDDNGNSPPATAAVVATTSAHAHAHAQANANANANANASHISDYMGAGVTEADVNDNATSGYLTTLKSGSSLQRLRAQFACSIK